MIVDEVVCGYLVTDEQLLKFANLELQPFPPQTNQIGFLLRAFPWFRKQPARLNFLRVQHPRNEDPRTTPIRILFPTRSRTNIDHCYSFNEIDKDIQQRDRVMDFHPSIRVLMTEAEFMTCANPSLSIRLPGEYLASCPSPTDSDSEEVLSPYYLLP